MLPPTVLVNLRVPAKAAHLAEQEGEEIIDFLNIPPKAF